VHSVFFLPTLFHLRKLTPSACPIFSLSFTTVKVVSLLSVTPWSFLNSEMSSAFTHLAIWHHPAPSWSKATSNHLGPFFDPSLGYIKPVTFRKYAAIPALLSNVAPWSFLNGVTTSVPPYLIISHHSATSSNKENSSHPDPSFSPWLGCFTPASFHSGVNIPALVQYSSNVTPSSFHNVVNTSSFPHLTVYTIPLRCQPHTTPLVVYLVPHPKRIFPAPNPPIFPILRQQHPIVSLGRFRPAHPYFILAIAAGDEPDDSYHVGALYRVIFPA